MKTMVNTAVSGGPGATDSSDVLLPGAKAGPWQVERELGRGGMGAVYAVIHAEIGKRAALKVVHQRLLVPGFNSDRMLLEAKVVNQVGHPNIVDIFETGQLGDGRPYIVMERLEGQSLSARAEDGKLLPDRVIAILLQVCDALIAAHNAGIVHRDLKLDNVFLVDNLDDPATPRVKLLDWGIAKVLSHDAKHTVDGQLVGTPQYLAPEQARGQAVSPQTDVYSLGVMAYELFLEQLPFEAETAAEVMAMHLRSLPPPPRELWPDIPPALEDLLLAMLSKQPAQRPTVLEVARRLDGVRDDLLRRCQPRPPRHPTAGPIDPATPARVISSAGLAATDLAGDAGGGIAARRWQYAVGLFALAASGMMFWISRTGDRSASAATALSSLTALTSLTAPGSPSSMESMESMEPSAPAEPGRVARVAGDGERTAVKPAISGTALISDLEPAADPPALLAPVPAAAAPAEVIASPRRAPRPVLLRPAVVRSAPARRSPAAPRRGTKVDPDGTFDPYR